MSKNGRRINRGSNIPITISPGLESITCPIADGFEAIQTKQKRLMQALGKGVMAIVKPELIILANREITGENPPKTQTHYERKRLAKIGDDFRAETNHYTVQSTEGVMLGPLHIMLDPRKKHGQQIIAATTLPGVNRCLPDALRYTARRLLDTTVITPSESYRIQTAYIPLIELSRGLHTDLSTLSQPFGPITFGPVVINTIPNPTRDF